ncbi:MAG: hypothetical protein P8144_12680, partial [Gammaproteobacteria bacterium]
AASVGEAMPADIELDRFMLAAEASLKANRLDEVARYLEKITALSTTPPPMYHYYKAQVARQQRQEEMERKALETYVSLAGKSGEHYTAALRRITELERFTEQENKAQTSAGGAEVVSGESSDQTGLLAELKEDKAKDVQRYAEQLKRLYLKDSFNEALVAHINGLLATHRYTGQRIHNVDDDHALAYSVSIADENRILVVKKDSLLEPERLTTDKTVVFGQNTFLEYTCDALRAYCVVKKPDLYSEWIKISFDEKAAQEISEALAQLMQNLQGGKDL